MSVVLVPIVLAFDWYLPVAFAQCKTFFQSQRKKIPEQLIT